MKLQFYPYKEITGITTKLTMNFWAEAVSVACFLINRSPRVALNGKVAKEVRRSNAVDYSNLRVFGCPAYVNVSSDERSKLDTKSRQCIFFRYPKGGKRNYFSNF